jgi:Rrf2 family transcriptional regulator, iron-sulfur cluster assembly transcription factor
MLSLSQTTGYAILALGFLHECGGRMVLAKEITQSTGIPLPYLSKILLNLSRAGLVVGKRGYRGGFTLARNSREISLYDVAEAVEGPDWLPTCMLGLSDCTAKPVCPTHAFWKGERVKIERELRTTTLIDVSCYVHKKFFSNGKPIEIDGAPVASARKKRKTTEALPAIGLKESAPARRKIGIPTPVK